MKYPDSAAELSQLLADDQAEKKALGKLYFTNDPQLAAAEATLRANTKSRTTRMLEILEKVGEPSISNIGIDGATAVSVLAVHADNKILQRVLTSFIVLYEQSPSDTHYSAIPSMTDLLQIFNHEPQIFGTQWFFDEQKQPILYPVEDFTHVNDRRAKYDIGPLRWPKSLAIPESAQPWLELPLSELIMRQPTDAEYETFTQIRN